MEETSHLATGLPLQLVFFYTQALTLLLDTGFEDVLLVSLDARSRAELLFMHNRSSC